MKLKFETTFRAFMVFLLLTLGWALWAGAQVATNRTSAQALNQPPALVRTVEQWNGRYLTFGLDRIPALRSPFLGEPLWKYPASLIYILVAFCIAKIIDVIAFVWLKKL